MKSYSNSTRDVAAVRRNLIRSSLRDIVIVHDLQLQETIDLLKEAVEGKFEIIKTIPKPEPTLETDGVPCSKCGKLMICNYGTPLCKYCKYAKTLKKCLDCSVMVDPTSTRCFSCNQKYQISKKKRERKGSL